MPVFFLFSPLPTPAPPFQSTLCTTTSYVSKCISSHSFYYVMFCSLMSINPTWSNSTQKVLQDLAHDYPKTLVSCQIFVYFLSSHTPNNRQELMLFLLFSFFLPSFLFLFFSLSICNSFFFYNRQICSHSNKSNNVRTYRAKCKTSPFSFPLIHFHP